MLNNFLPALRALALLAALTSGVSSLIAAEMPNETKTTVCTLKYANVKTDTGEFSKWAAAFSGRLETTTKLAYRRVTLEPGQYDVWITPAKKPGHFYFCVGTQSDEESVGLRALFKLYEEEESLDQLTVELQEVSKGRKLKFSIRGGKREGHGNLKIVADEPESD